MNATELYHKDGKSTGIFFCAGCRTVHRAQPEADQCCAPRHCPDCPELAPKHRIYCQSCEDKRAAAREAARYDKAEKVTSWDGWLYCESLSGHNEGYFESVADLLEYAADDEHDGPDYAWTCHARAFCQLDFDSILESATQDAYEDWDSDSVNGVEDFKAAIAVFNEANKEHVSYAPNYKKALVLKVDHYQPSPSFILPVLFGGAL